MVISNMYFKNIETIIKKDVFSKKKLIKISVSLL